MDDKLIREGLSLVETPTWAVATVVTIMVTLVFFFHGSLKRFGKWLHRTKRKSLFAALEKIKEELMLFGLLSLLMGHWIVIVAKICVKSSVLSIRFYPCEAKSEIKFLGRASYPDFFNRTVFREQLNSKQHHYCPEGRESFASQESLEQLHRFLFVLGTTHVAYSFVAIALAMIKIYHWRTWENQAKLMAIQGSSLDTQPRTTSNNLRMRQLSTFIFHRTSHPWSQHRVFVWLLCFSRQFWSSINHDDYMALRLGFIYTHQLPLTYDFHKYILRSMEEEFRDIVGISVPLWIYAIFCIFLDFHGTNAYFWLSFLPAILILVIGTKLHRVVVKLAVEIMYSCTWKGHHEFKLRNELFWFRKPRLLLWLIQFISFQNAFEMATFLWSLWEIREPSCFMENRFFLVIRLTFGITTQCWCSFITFPLYVIITQMGSRLKKTVISESVRESLHDWQRRVKARHSPSFALRSVTSTTSLESMEDEIDNTTLVSSSNIEASSSRIEDISVLHQQASVNQVQAAYEQQPNKDPLFSGQVYDIYDEDDDNDHDNNDNVKDSSCNLPPPEAS